MTLLAAIGFAATNIGDGVAGRGRLAAEASALTADVTRLRIERAGIAEARSVATIEAEIQRAQPAAAAVWKQTAGCSDVTLAASGAACAEVLKLRQALGAAQRRDALDAELRAAEAQLAPLPAIVTADPQATMAADILAWISAGRVSLTPHDIHRLRVTGLTVIPALAGIIFLFATTLLRADGGAPPDAIRPHPEEPSEARRLEGWGAPWFETRFGAPHHEAERDRRSCGTCSPTDKTPPASTEPDAPFGGATEIGPLIANTASWNLSPAFTCVPSTTRLGMLRPWIVAGDLDSRCGGASRH